MIIEPKEPEPALAAEDPETVSRLLNLADKMIELSQQERKRLAVEVEAAEAQEELQAPV